MGRIETPPTPRMVTQHWTLASATRWIVGCVALLPVALLLPFAVFWSVNSEYSFTWLYVGTTASALAVIGLAMTQPGKAALIVSTVAVLAVAGTALYTISLWPGGDDGSGMGWMILVVIPSLAVGAFSSVGLWSLYGLATIFAKRRHRSTLRGSAV